MTEDVTIICQGMSVSARETVPGVWRCTGCGERVAVVSWPTARPLARPVARV